MQKSGTAGQLQVPCCKSCIATGTDLCAEGERRLHGRHCVGSHSHVAMEGLHKEAAPQRAGTQAGVQMAICLF